MPGGLASFTKSLALANSYLSTNRLPDYISELIDQDMAETLPQTKLFQGEGPMAFDLKNLLLAYSVFWKEKPSYARISHVLCCANGCRSPAASHFLAPCS
jgi:hypothetical protein